jgi:hypothetical protein
MEGFCARKKDRFIRRGANCNNGGRRSNHPRRRPLEPLRQTEAAHIVQEADADSVSDQRRAWVRLPAYRCCFGKRRGGQFAVNNRLGDCRNEPRLEQRNGFLDSLRAFTYRKFAGKGPKLEIGFSHYAEVSVIFRWFGIRSIFLFFCGK